MCEPAMKNVGEGPQQFLKIVLKLRAGEQSGKSFKQASDAEFGFIIIRKMSMINFIGSRRRTVSR